jgi:anthranilate phosphoribosyltransferase
VSGAADMFAHWGVDADVPGEAQVKSTETCRLGFTSVVGRAFMDSGFARVISQIRIGTSFHIGGPLVRHVGERHKIAGVPEPSLVRLVCEVMRDLGYTRALVPCGESREHPGRYLDELSTVGPTHIAELEESGEIREYVLRPEDAGLAEAKFDTIATRPTAAENARVVARALAGKEHGPVVDILLLNAAAGLVLMGKVADLASGVTRARKTIEEGRAIAQLRALIETQNAKPQEGLAQLASLIAD